MPHYIFGDKIIQNCFKIDETHYYDKDLLLRRETKKKRLHVLEADMITIKNDIDVSSSKNAFFTGHVPKDHHWACLCNESLSY